MMADDKRDVTRPQWAEAWLKVKDKEREERIAELAEAFGRALKDVLPFTEDGALRVHSESGSSMKGGGT